MQHILQLKPSHSLQTLTKLSCCLLPVIPLHTCCHLALSDLHLLRLLFQDKPARSGGMLHQQGRLELRADLLDDVIIYRLAGPAGRKMIGIKSTG